MRSRSRILIVSIVLAAAVGLAVFLLWGGDFAPSERARWAGISGLFLLLLLLMGAASRRRRGARDREPDRG